VVCFQYCSDVPGWLGLCVCVNTITLEPFEIASRNFHGTFIWSISHSSSKMGFAGAAPVCASGDTSAKHIRNVIKLQHGTLYVSFTIICQMVPGRRATSYGLEWKCLCRSRVVIMAVQDGLQRWMKVALIDLRNLRERPCSSDHRAADVLPLHDATSPSTACSSAVVTHDSAGTSTMMNDATATRRRRSSDVLLFTF